MNTKETAEALGVSERTIRRHAESMGLTENGKQTELDEKAVTIIKKQIERSGRNDLDNVVQLPNVNTVSIFRLRLLPREINGQGKTVY